MTRRQHLNLAWVSLTFGVALMIAGSPFAFLFCFAAILLGEHSVEA